MTPIAARNALVAHLQAMPDRPAIAYPDGPIVKAVPRIHVDLPSIPQVNLTLKGKERADAQLAIRVETEDGDLTNQSQAIVENILSHFAPVQTVQGVKIMRAPQVQQGFPRDGIYYQPMLIQGRFYT